jgi:hypothetical protein
MKIEIRTDFVPVFDFGHKTAADTEIQTYPYQRLGAIRRLENYYRYRQHRSIYYWCNKGDKEHHFHHFTSKSHKVVRFSPVGTS